MNHASSTGYLRTEPEPPREEPASIHLV